MSDSDPGRPEGFIDSYKQCEHEINEKGKGRDCQIVGIGCHD